MSGCILRGQIFQNVFEDQAGDGIDGFVTLLDDNTMMAIAIAKRFRDSLQLQFLKYWRIVQRAFFNQNCKKRYKTD